MIPRRLNPLNLILPALATIALLFFACDVSGGNGTPGSTTPPSSKAAKVQLAFSKGAVVAGALAHRSISPGVGAATSTGLVSLKYYIISIKLWKADEISLSGSGFAPTGTGLTIFEQPLPISAGGNPQQDWTPAEATAQTEGFYDLMSAADVAKLVNSVSVDASKVGTYSYVTINWMPYIKVAAKLTLSNGETVYTHPLDPLKILPTPTKIANTTVAFDFTNLANGKVMIDLWAHDGSGAEIPEEAVVKSNNGGNCFALPAPLVISDADVEAENAYKVTLVFNPDGIVQGGHDVAGLFDIQEAHYDASGNFSGYGLSLPMLDLAAIALPASSALVRETYTVDVTDGKGGPLLNANEYYHGRLALFYDSADSTKGIKGVEFKLLPNPSSATHPTTNVVPLIRQPKVSAIIDNGNGTLNLMDMAAAGTDGFAPQAIFKNFTRFSATTDPAGSVLFLPANPRRNYPQHNTGDTLPSGTDWISASYSLTAIDTLQ